MYRTTSVMALGLFIGLAPIGALAQTQTDDTDTQVQTTQQSDTQSTQTETLQSDDQQATETEVDIPEDDDAEMATDTETDMTTGDDAEMATDTETQTTTGDDAEMTTDTQTETTTGDDAEMATDTEMETTTGDDAEMATDTETETTTGDAEVATTDTEEVPDVIPEQDTSEMLGSSLMGASVNLADEEIGNVSDLIIADDNSIRGVVVGVGGFLGIGEKRVALPVERLTIRTTEPGEVEISTDMTRQELEEKEAFKTAAQVRSEEEAAQAQQEAETMQPATEPAIPQQ